MASSQLSDLDFQRLQENLLDLKNQNYNLDAQAKKSKHALGDATARVRVLEEALEKANRTLDKSKKALEVQQLIKENEALNQKLRFQEDQFNEQNQTMMKEYCELVKKNEELKSELEHRDLNKETTSQPESDQEHLSDKEISSDLQKLKIDLNHKKEELMKKEGEVVEKEGMIEQLVQEKNKLDQELHHVDDEKNNLVQEVQDLKEHLEGTKIALDDLKETSERLEEDHLKTIEELKLQLSQYPPEHFKELEAKNICLHNEVQAYKDQMDREIHKCHAMASDLANDRVQLEELHRQNEANNEAMAKLEADLKAAHQLCEKRKQLIDQMNLESQEQTDKIRQLGITHEKRIEEITKSHQEEITNLESKVQAKHSEMQTLVLNKQAQIDQITAAKDSEIKSITDLKDKHIADLDEQINNLKQELSHKDDLIEQVDSEKRKLEVELTESKSAIENLTSDNTVKVSELETQLELSNVQKVEFEEKCARLEGEIRDLQEEKKVIERKSHARLKDLKKELVKEQRRNEKLQERLKDCVIDTESNHSDQTRDLDADRSSISSWSLMSGQNERDRETSTPCQLSPGLPCSFSETSLNNIDHSTTSNRLTRVESRVNPGGQPNSHQPQQLVFKVPQGPQPQPEGHNPDLQQEPGSGGQGRHKDPETDYLLEKVASLQEEKWKLEENLQMLEQSGAAMADEIVRKNNLIQFYCMDSRRPQSTSHVQAVHHQPSSGADKMKMFVGKLDRLVHSDQQAELHNKEMQRLQQMLEETLTKNMHLQQNMDTMSQELVRLSKLVPVTTSPKSS